MKRLLLTRSLRVWLAIGMLVAMAPLGVSLVAGYLLLSHGVIAPFHDVASRHGSQMAPLQQQRLTIWETLAPVDEYVEDGDPLHIPAYRHLRQAIETGFASLHEALRDEPEKQAVLVRAREDWADADRFATDLVSVTGAAAMGERTETLQRFHGSVAAANDKLAAIHDRIAQIIADDHGMAVRSYERSIWIAGLATSLSLLMLVCGVLVIGRILAASVDRLVDGAARFAAGERGHRIEVQVPPELRRVADEFNHMIRQIHASEKILADMAHLDTLTAIGNRRAFDQAFNEQRIEVLRHGQALSMLAVDIDHFKRINDSWGHAVGDDVLRAVARAIRESLRPTDMAFRMGGEEFAILLPRTDSSKAVEVAERLRRAIEATRVETPQGAISATASIGVAQASERPDQDWLLKAADKALYRAKGAGRNRVVQAEEAEPGARTAA